MVLRKGARTAELIPAQHPHAPPARGFGRDGRVCLHRPEVDTARLAPMARKVRGSPSHMEREVIVAVIALYAMICAMVLAIHHLQPGGLQAPPQETPMSKPVRGAATPLFVSPSRRDPS